MDFRTIVDVPAPPFRIPPFERMLLVGSCFAESIGQRLAEEKFRAVVNPFGVMYNPASILHTVERWLGQAGELPRVAFLTLGTNHVYVLKETGEIVDNCQKRPQRLFREEELSVEQCLHCLIQAVGMLREACPEVRVVVTVSPIRYAKYGFHGSALSKASLLLAADRLCARFPDVACYFPAYEIVNDELRDYRFYQPDMLHPSQQAVDYIWERFAGAYLSEEARLFIREWAPLRKALAHHPFRPDSEEYRAFMRQTRLKVEALEEKWGQIFTSFNSPHTRSAST